MPKKEIQLIPYEERFGGAFPKGGFPLPVPAPRRKIVPGKDWDFLLNFAEKFVQQTRETKMNRVLPKRYNKPLRDMTLDSLRAEILVGMDFYLRYISIPPEEDILENYPKGLEILIERSRELVLRAVQIVRAQDWALFYVDEYASTYRRCRWSCEGKARMRTGVDYPVPALTSEDVKATMKTAPNGFQHLVDYNHIGNALMKEVENGESLRDSRD